MSQLGIEQIDRGNGQAGSGDSAFTFTGKINAALQVFENLLLELQSNSAQQGDTYAGTLSDLKDLIDGLNAIVTSDDTSLDELQEIVSFIKQNKTDLENLSVSNIAGLQSALDEKATSDEVSSLQKYPLSITNRNKWFGDFAPHPTLNLATSRSIAQLSLGANENNTAVHFIIDNRASDSGSVSLLLQGFMQGHPTLSPSSQSPTRNSPLLSVNDILPLIINGNADVPGQEYEFVNIGSGLGSTGNYKISYYYVGDHPTRGALSAVKIYNNVDANPFFSGFIDATSFHIGSISPEILSVVLNNGEVVGINDEVPIGSSDYLISNGVQDTLILSQI